MLKFSKQGDYGLVLMVALAEQFPTGQWISLSDIAKEKNISYLFLTQIIRPLKKEKLVEAKEGISGGYRLTKEPSAITVGSILRSIIGNVEPSTCTTSDKTCERQDSCPAVSVWQAIQQKVDDVLDNTTLQNLLDTAKTAKRIA
ncbi:MAG: Rrf2 family transcriptional regulator [bacterium]